MRTRPRAHFKCRPWGVLAALLGVRSVTAFYEKCSEEAGGGYCPGQNTCCGRSVRPAFSLGHNESTDSLSSRRRRDRDVWGEEKGGGGGGGCIPSDLGSYSATCCSKVDTDGPGRKRRANDDNRDDPLTGCGVGYACGPHNTCLAVDPGKDLLVAVLPRYRLGRQVRREPPPLYGFPMTTATCEQPDDENCLKLAYYSTHGDLFGDPGREKGGEDNGARSTRVSDDWKDVDTVFVVVHGVLRNADDYFCTAESAASRLPGTRKAWVIAPLFAFWNESASNLRLANGGRALRWGDDGTDPWRSGANAMSTRNATHDPHDDDSLSSYRALDELVAHVLRLKRAHLLPHLKLVVVAGHSSGGQYVQRWSLLSPVWDARLLRAVVANPSSYAYLSPERYNASTQWTIPPIIDCPAYDQWQWGLSGAANASNAFTNPYLRRQLSAVGGVDGLVERFRTRRVIYLAGRQDRCNVSGTSDGGWCDSHGLETTCMDLLQGSNRWERYNRYLSSLRRLEVPTEQVVVTGVGHDHSLMFQSPAGRRALFSFEGHPSRYGGEESRLTYLDLIVSRRSYV